MKQLNIIIRGVLMANRTTANDAAMGLWVMNIHDMRAVQYPESYRFIISFHQ